MHLSLRTQVGSQSSRCTRTAPPRAPTLLGLSGQRTRTAMHPVCCVTPAAPAKDSLGLSQFGPPDPTSAPTDPEAGAEPPALRQGTPWTPPPARSLSQPPLSAPGPLPVSPLTLLFPPPQPAQLCQSPLHALHRLVSVPAKLTSILPPQSGPRGKGHGAGGKQEGPASCGTGPCHPTPPGHPAQRQHPDAFLQTFYTEVISRAPLGPQAP